MRSRPALLGLSMLAIFALAVAEPARGQVCDPRKILGPPCKSQLEVAVGAVVETAQRLGQAAALKADFSRQIAVARQRFFSSYPDGPGHAEAEREFASLLLQKDLYFLYLNHYAASLESRDSVSARAAIRSNMQNLDTVFGLGARLDGGIREAAATKFERWARAVRDGFRSQPVNNLDDLRRWFHDAPQRRSGCRSR